jgi:hypothetical protein
MENRGGMILTGEIQGTRRKTCCSASLSTTNPTWANSGTNPDLRGERTATNRLSHGTAKLPSYYISFNVCQKKCPAFKMRRLVCVIFTELKTIYNYVP